MALDLSDDDELGEFIYRTSQTAKLLREKQEKEDKDIYKATNRSIENHLLPINLKKEEAVKNEVKTEDDVSTDDEDSPEYVISSSVAGYDPIKSEETDNEDLADEDTNTSNEQHLLPCDSSNDEYGSEMKETEQQKSTQSLANDTTRPRASFVQESIDIQCITKKRKREKEESKSVKKTTHRICSVEGCNRKAAGNGTCFAKHKGYNHCKHEGCNKVAKKGGVCMRHGAVVKSRTCKVEGCTNIVQKGGVCVKHGAVLKICNHEGCTNQAQNRGVCVKHGAAVKTCSHEGCTNKAKGKGVCYSHGAKRVRKTCSHKGCNNLVVNKGVCIKHGAKVKTCGHKGCTNKARGKERVCMKHGATC